ncbi:BC1881 family protein [Lactiplantibacillus plantarum]|uniref:BC1881 family protein n=1 Tax=Lactiplantibacillus plantarum TaxID=1590 RepID=UPI001AFB7A51|nr:BC1881 family protein [Lactiplantibacillus plantarum]MBY7658422.1 BC1881 family protein [Lactiplantibacillus plantarum]QSE53386.1 BC1881 family protein [Lactiplantibacillus plantarum]
MKLSEFSTGDLIKELSNRKGIQHVTAGLYQEFKVVGKYANRNIEFPEKYELLII